MHLYMEIQLSKFAEKKVCFQGFESSRVWVCFEFRVWGLRQVFWARKLTFRREKVSFGHKNLCLRDPDPGVSFLARACFTTGQRLVWFSLSLLKPIFSSVPQSENMCFPQEKRKCVMCKHLFLPQNKLPAASLLRILHCSNWSCST